MIQSKVLIAGVLLSAIAALAVVSEPALAGTCVAVTVKGRGPDPATATHQGSGQAHAACRQPARQGQEELDQLPEGPAWGLRVHDLCGRLSMTLKSPLSAAGDMMVTCRKLG
jgi:hypothetical protein